MSCLPWLRVTRYDVFWGNLASSATTCSPPPGANLPGWPVSGACRYARQAADRAAREAEAARQQAAAEAEAEAARLRQERRQRERPLREVVGWIRATARAPAEAPSKPTVAQRAQRAVRLVGHLAAQMGDGA